MDEKSTINDIKSLVQKFCEERDWDKFHDGKELAIGIVTEASELLDHFRFKSKEQIEEIFKNEEKRNEISEELADTLYFVLRFAQMYNIDLTSNLHKKIEKNAKKYPINKVKGCNKKYTEY
jgi:NTP pyrophosphatase (non-canonical NTP hydrolase)